MSGTHADTREAEVAPTPECPADDVITAHVAGKLSDEERERVALHLDSCEACRDVVIHAVRWAKLDALARGSTPAFTEESALATTKPGDPPVEAVATPERVSLPKVLAGRYELKKLIGKIGRASGR